ncbi:32687_t:CDS:2 [Gigaspora margarita]|uniref:32687_t:CDS:1 n=1 Tax=Gigaspora margarita TaxID=4874 RepID=A0ABN7VB60_GIGMA|nr:32687_t:CDS:2 [Gigaspora margarita]
MGCIVGSTLSNNETNIKTYNNISVIINKIKENNIVAKYVRAYILQVSLPKFPSVIIALLPNLGSDKTETILDIHKLLLDFAQELKLHIISIGSNGTQVEFNAQTQLQQISTFIDLLRQRENKKDEIDINEENKNLDECKKQLSFINMVKIETSNNAISADFGDVIFATKNRIDYQEMIYQPYYGTQLCIGQVISSFYKAYGYHSYNQEPITNIENISYLILKVFTPIRNIFSAEVEEGHVLITHQCPKNILYHLDTQDIQIFDNTLQLLEKAKACYNFFKKKEIAHIINMHNN